MADDIFKIDNGVLVEVLKKNIINAVIPDGVTRIGKDAFWKCTLLTNIRISDGVTSIGDRAFADCESLTSVTIPDSVKNIGNWVFCNCTSLTEINVSPFNNDYYSQDGVLFNKFKTKLIQYPAGKLDESYIIPNSVKNIGEGAFEECISLTSVTLPIGTISIGNSAFYRCISLKSITIPDSVKNIGKWAFEECTSLKSPKANYKAFKIRENDLICNDYIFTPNKWSKHKRNIKLCERGYHFCTNLFEIFTYYSGELDKDIIIYECEVGKKVKHSDTSICVTNKVSPVKRLYRKDIIKFLNV